MLDRNLALGLNSGSVIGVPIPEESSIVGQEIEDAIQMALEESRLVFWALGQGYLFIFPGPQIFLLNLNDLPHL